ncbi:MAG TPA: YeeE/YedE thiosulfate transporter family protein [Burkholderiaceae bacterium]|nr:YeeE/YedE thiosulfate transporter family protein [Burkholderiaceae bacterium]
MDIASTFTPLPALIGGLVIGAATALYLLGNGRVAGIAGIVAGPLRTLFARHATGTTLSRLLAPPYRASLLFIAGLLLAPWLWRLFAPWPPIRVAAGPAMLIAAGLLVGIGVRMANGCTSGHGVCGLSRFSLRSGVNVLVFMAAGVITVTVVRHVF